MLWFILFLGCAVAIENVSVIRQLLTLEDVHTLRLNNTVEYILEFIPNAEQSQFPSKFWLKVDGGDTTHPLLITARQRKGAVTWQLPYYSGNQLLHEIERTLCSDNAVVEDSECANSTDVMARTPNSFTLQLSSSCAADVEVTVLAAPLRQFRLPFQERMAVSANTAVPSVRYYQFAEGQDSVRLELSSEDEVCAMISVQNITCPILQSEDQLNQAGLRMTMIQSGGVYLSRSRFPEGFYVVVAVLSTDKECSGEVEEDDAWMWALMWGQQAQMEMSRSRVKHVYVTVQASLSRGNYLLATGVTLMFCLVFYVGFFALVYAQRYPAFAKHVAPKAPLAEVHLTEIGPTANGTSQNRQRRNSTATFDSSEDSNSDEEDIPSPAAAPAPVCAPAAPRAPAAVSDDVRGERPREENDGTAEGNTDQPGVTDVTEVTDVTGPYGLPAALRLAALSRNKARVISARSDRYLHTLYTVAIFYALPVIQFVAAFQLFLNVSGTLDTCYYNFLCSHPLGKISDFNHVFSNIGYLLLGALFMLQLRRRRRRRVKRPRLEEYGIPPHYGMLSSLGAAMMVVGVLSASYHVCPNRLNFQFDTAFMYVLSVVSMVKIYQSRHPDVNARAHATFGVLAGLIALVVWGVILGSAIFWAVFTVIHLFTFLILSLKIYYVGQFRLERDTLQRAARGLAALPKYGVRPLYKTLLIMLLIANGVNWALGLYGLWSQSPDVAGHLLKLLLCNTLLYMVFYLAMKVMNGERPRWFAWCYLAGATAAWIPSLYFFVSGSSDWSTTPAKSRHLNHQCMMMNFYDAHDLWHLLSAVALYLSFNAILTWDDGLAAVKRTEIAVF